LRARSPCDDKEVLMTRPRSVLAIGGAWCTVAIACSAWLVPSDGASGFYLVDHGRIEHFDTRLAAVTPFVAIAVFLFSLAAVILLLGTGVARAAARGGVPLASVPAAAKMGSVLPMLLAGLIPLSVIAAARGDAWPTWLVLVVVVLAVLALLGGVVRTVRRAHGAMREGRTH
jgi:hypothetical protein